MDRFDRIYALHATLRKARYPVSSERLCDELNCKQSTLRSIVRQMRDQFRAPIETSRHDGGGYWYEEKRRETFELPGLWFNPSELLALTACLKLLHEVEPGVLEPAIEPLRERVEALLENRHLGAAGESHRIRILKLAARPHDPDVFRNLAEAVLLRRRISFVFTARQDGKCSEREVSPQRLTHYRDNWYLDAFDHRRDDLRTFSIDNISRPQVLNTAAKFIDEAVLNQELGASYGIFSGKAKQVAVLRFTAERARWVAHESWHPEQHGEWLEDGRYELRIPYADMRELILDILRYGPDVEVVSPRTLRDEVTDRLRAAIAQYQSEALPL